MGRITGTMVLLAAVSISGAHAAVTPKEMTTLLSRLDLDRKGLEKVKAAAGDAERAAAELLAYYRARKSVKHPVDRSKRAEVRKKRIPKRVKEVADDALKNILVTCPHYPRHNFGKDIDWFKNRSGKGDREWIWQLHRHSSWGSLGRAYWYTGDERYARAYVRQLLDWIRKCPRKKSSAAWRTIETGLRGCSWTRHFNRFVDSPSYSPDVLVKHLNSFSEHAEWLYAVLRSRGKSNWGLMEAEGLSFIAITFPEFKSAEKWRKRAFAYLNRQITGQIRPDGHHWEQCLGYHMGAISWFARTAELAAANGLKKEFPPEYFKRLEDMCAVFMKLGFPDGTHTQFGDDHSRFGWPHKLRKWGPIFKRKDFSYVVSKGKEGKPPAGTAFALTHSGFYSMRGGWGAGDTCLVLKCGPSGSGHCQPDNGTFEIYSGGRRLTPDSGSYIYSGDTAGRKWFRQTRVHQTLTLDGKDTAYKPRLRLWKPGGKHDILVVENAGYKGLTHRRAVIFVNKKFFVLVDEALGKAKGSAYLHFQLAPGKAFFYKNAPAARTDFETGTNLLVIGMPQPGMKLVKEKGQVSFKYATRGPRPAFRLEMKKAEKSLRFVTVLVPYRGKVPKVEVALVDAPAPGAAAVQLDVAVNGASTRVGYDLRTPKGKAAK